MIAEYLAEQKRLAEAATEGPWRHVETAYGESVEVEDGEQLFIETYGITYAWNGDNAAFIAAARESVPRMIAAIEAVMRIHRSVESFSGEQVCAHRYCVDSSLDQSPWPCPTSRAVEAALGGEGDGN